MTKKALITMTSAIGFAAVSMASMTTQQAPILLQSFKDSDGGWMAFGGAAKTSVSHEPELTQASAGALRFDYTISKGDFNGLYLPVTIGSWEKAKSVKFRVHSDAPTVLVVALQKQDGGRFVSMVSTPKGLWQTVELSTSDFILSQDKDDPKDPTGKLDMSKVVSVGIADISQFFLSIDNPVLSGLFDVKKGEHRLYVDSFTVGSESIPSGFVSQGDDVLIDTLSHPQVSWIGLGGMKIVRATEPPLSGAAIRADYHQTPGKPSILSRSVPSWVLIGAKSLTFDVASAKPAKLVVQLEQVDGGKYNAVVDLPGGSILTKVKLPLSDFKRSDDATDNDTKVHPALLKSLMIMDASGMLEQANSDNTLWVNHIAGSGS